jgi:hypothetical protein
MSSKWKIALTIYPSQANLSPQTVGLAGGYIAGGGHSPMSSAVGMAADQVSRTIHRNRHCQISHSQLQVLSMEVVLPNGQFVHASATSNPDLFWALRGGGGSKLFCFAYGNVC